VCKCGEKRKGDQLEGCTHIQSDEKIALVLDLITPWYTVSTESIEQMYDVKSDEFHAMVRTSKDLYHNKSGTILDQGQARYQRNATRSEEHVQNLHIHHVHARTRRRSRKF
jgi:hypothetical protein